MKIRLNGLRVKFSEIVTKAEMHRGTCGFG